eukprot:gene15797-7102_t
MGLILLPLFTFLFFKSVDGYCSGGTKTASTYSNTLSHLYYSNNEDCTFYINPQHSTGYYLEIKWVSFSVEGSLPSCSNDSVEVYLTSDTSGRAGVFYTAGWPIRYFSGGSNHCYMRYYVGRNSLKVVVMDLDIFSPSYCYSYSPYFQVKGSNSRHFGKNPITILTTAVSTKLCGTQSPRSYTTDYNYVYLFFNKPTATTVGRGFVVGYVEYGECIIEFQMLTASKHKLIEVTEFEDTQVGQVGQIVWSGSASWSNWSRWSSSKSSGSGTAIGASIGSIVFVAIIIGFIYGCCRASCRANRGAVIVAQQGQTAQAAPIVNANVSNNVATSQATTLAPTTTAGYMPPPQGAPAYMPPQGAPGYMYPPKGAPGYMPPPQGAPGYMPPPQDAPGYMPPPQGAPGYMPSPDG